MEKEKRVLGKIEPESVFEYFEDICAIPHGSGNTKQISDWCVAFAKEHNLYYYQDEKNNVIIRKSATVGYETHPTVIIQGHLDMVCEKDADCKIDFSKDGLSIYLQDGMISAHGTTLGGDDGIAVAMAMSILADNTLSHPEIEALFTVDEETGMYGAEFLDTSSLKGKLLLNIDSEAEGVLTVGCAGGARADIKMPLESALASGEAFKITLYGFLGGHSGTEIAKSIYNPNIIMGSFLRLLDNEWYLVDIKGGLKDNAIPVMCESVIYSNQKTVERARKRFESTYQKQLNNDFKIKIEKAEEQSKNAFSLEDSKKAAELLGAVPNGVIEMSEDINGLVQTSLNLGVLKIEDSNLQLTFAVRSSVSQSKAKLIEKLQKTADEFGCEFTSFGHYPAWEYKKDSVLRDKMVFVYERMFGAKPKIDVIHAGLECGLFCEKISELDAVSFGPDLFDIHTTRERMSVESVRRTYEFLCQVLKEL